MLITCRNKILFADYQPYDAFTTEHPIIEKLSGKHCRNILICGWRDIWILHPMRLYDRIVVRASVTFFKSMINYMTKPSCTTP